MVRITEGLVRKRAEHNDGLITTLEELTLHQEGIERLECLDKWCRDLKILYLQNNLIPKIENVSRLKHLEYLNLTLNNITEIANLEGCESLVKLDLTINFIWKLTSVETLVGNYNLRQLFLVGNPCAEYEGYRSFVIGTLPQLTSLDGLEVTRTERYEANKDLTDVRKLIIKQQDEYLKKTVLKQMDENHNIKTNDSDESLIDENYWTTPTEYTPESRVKAQKYGEYLREKRNSEDAKDETKPKERNLLAKAGRPLNVNEAKLNFKLTEEDDGNSFVLEIKLFKFLETSDVSVDCQPDYVRLWVKGKVFQLVLPESVHPDTSKAERSRATGKLVIRMPKARLDKVIVGSGNLKQKNVQKTDQNVSSKDGKKETHVDAQNSQTQKSDDYQEDMPELI